MSRQEIVREATIKATPERVFEIASDTARAKEWLPNIVSAKAKGAKKGLGSERNVELQFHNYRILSHQKITHFEPGKKFGWTHLEDVVDGEKFEMLEDVGTTLDLEAQGKGTHVRALVHFKPRGLKARLAVPLIRHDIEKQTQIALENLKRLCEAK